MCLNKPFLGTQYRFCSPSYHLWNLRSDYLGWKFYSKSITFPYNWILSHKMKLPINICSCSSIKSLKVKKPVFIIVIMAESQFCQHHEVTWTAFKFFFKFTYHIFYIKCPSPINCSNKPFSWCPPDPPELWGRGFFVSQKLFWLALESFSFWRGRGESIWRDLRK